jgi:hypothetical protein
MISHGAIRIFGAAVVVTFSTIVVQALGTLVLLSSPVMAQQSVPEIPFESIPDPLKLPPDLYFGEATGVAVNSKGHVFVFSRGNTTGPAYAASAAQLLEFGPDGKFIREIGKNLYAWSFGHAVRIDKDDNIWAIDKGSDMVIRFNPEGRVTMVFLLTVISIFLTASIAVAESDTQNMATRTELHSIDTLTLSDAQFLGRRQGESDGNH